jgi:tetratricopeptide (TPR) repeat protein
VAAVLLNGQWRIFDPVFGLVFREEKTGEIAIFDDIQKRGGSLKSDRFDRIGRLARSQAIPASADLKNFHDTYFTHFEPAHPAQWSGSYAQRGFLRRTVETFLNLYFAAVGRRGAFLLQDIYLQRHWPYNTIKSMYNRGRHYHLFGRSGKAETAYREVIAAVHTVAAVPLNGQWGIFDPAHDLVFRDEKTGEIAMVAGNGRPWFDRASFHYGRLLLDLGRARDAQIQFEKTSHNNSIWKDPAAYYLSRIALKQGNQSRALALIEPTLKYLDTDAPLLFMNLTLASKTSSLQTP